MFKYRKLIRILPLALCICILGNMLKGPFNAAFFHMRRDLAGRKILSAVSGYEISEGYYGTVYYTEQDQDYIAFIQRTIDTYYPLLAKDFDILPSKSLIFVVYPEKTDLSHAIGINYNEKPPMGVYYGGIINILSPDYWIELEKESEKKELFLEKGPIIHEMAHFFLEEKTEGNYETWFTEGVALYYEYKYTGIEWRGDLSGVSRDIAPADMAGLFKTFDEASAYRCAFEIILNMVYIDGEAGLKNIIAELGLGTDFHQVLS